MNQRGCSQLRLECPPRLVVDLDADAGAHEPLGPHALDELVGPQPEGEGELVDAVERRLELLRDLELGRRRAGEHPRLLAPRRPVVREGARRAESATHVGLGQGRELAEGAHPESVQQGADAGVDDEAHRQRRDEGSGCPGRDDAHGRPALAVAARSPGLAAASDSGTRRPRRLLGRERPVGDPHACAHHVERGDGVEQRPRRGILTAVVARRAAGPHGERAGADELHPGHRLLDPPHDRLEDAHVERAS